MDRLVRFPPFLFEFVTTFAWRHCSLVKTKRVKYLTTYCLGISKNNLWFWFPDRPPYNVFFGCGCSCLFNTNPTVFMAIVLDKMWRQKWYPLSQLLANLRLHVLHYQSFCDRSTNFAKVHSTFWRICKNYLRELTQTFLTNPSKLRIHLCKIPTVITETLIV